MRIFFIWILIPFTFTWNNIKSQSIQEDILLLEKYSCSFSAKDNNFRSNAKVNDKTILLFKHNNFFTKYNPVSLLALTSMYIYQSVISPQYYSKCMYQMSCSNYSKAAIREFGLIKGVFLSADRLLRCNLQAVDDVPSCDFDSEGYAIDEPSKYHICK